MQEGLQSVSDAVTKGETNRRLYNQPLFAQCSHQTSEFLCSVAMVSLKNLVL